MSQDNQMDQEASEEEEKRLLTLAEINLEDPDSSQDGAYDVDPFFREPDRRGVAGPSRGHFIKTRTKNPYLIFPWLQHACKEIRIHITSDCANREILSSMDRYIKYIKDNLCGFIRYPNRCFVLARTMTTTMFVFKNLNKGFTDSHEYLLKITEMLGIYTLFELKYSAQYCMSKSLIAERLTNNYDVHLQTADISYTLRIFLYVQHFCQETEVMVKIFEKYLKKTLKQRAELPDKTFALYIVVFKIWKGLFNSNINEQLKIDEFANTFMKPPPTFRSNPRYAPHIPVYKINDENATRSILQTKFDIRNIMRILKAEDKLESEKGPIEVIDLDPDETSAPPQDETIDLVNEQNCDNDVDIKHETPSVVATIDLTEDERTKDLAWLKAAIDRAKDARPLVQIIERKNQSDRVIEIIELDDDDEEEEVLVENNNASSNIEDIQNINDNNVATSLEPDTAVNAIEKDISNINISKEIESPIIENNSKNSEQNLLNKSSSEIETVSISETNTDKPCIELEIAKIPESTSVDSCTPMEIEDSVSSEVVVNTSEKEKECNIVNNEELTPDVQNINSNLNNLNIGSNSEENININKNILAEKDQLISENITNKNIIITSTPVHIPSVTQPEDSIVVQDVNNIERSATPAPLVITEKADEVMDTTTEDAFITADDDEALSPIPSPYLTNATSRHESPTEFLFRDHDDSNHCREIQTNGFDDNISFSTSDNTITNLSQSCLKTYEGKRKNFPQPSINLTEVPVRESIGLDPPIFSPYSSDDSRDSIALSILEESETPDSSKDDDMHIDKILPTTTTKTNPIKPTNDSNVVFSISAGKKLSLPPPPPDDFDLEDDISVPRLSSNVVFSTGNKTTNQRNDQIINDHLEKQDKNSSSQNNNIYLSPINTGRNNFDNDELDELKSPPVEGFSASDADELVELIDRHSKGTKNNYQKTTEKAYGSVTEIPRISSNIFLNDGDSINETPDGNYQRRSIHFDTSEDFPTDNLPSYQKRKTVSFAELKNDKPAPFVNRIKTNTDSTILERKTYDLNRTYNESNTWRSPTITTLNNTINQQKTQYELPSFNDDIERASTSRNKDTDDGEKIGRFCSEINSKEIKRNILKKVFNPIRSRKDQWEINKLTPKRPDPVIKLPYKPAKALSDFDRYLAERKRRESINSNSPSRSTPIMQNKLLQSPITKINITKVISPKKNNLGGGNKDEENLKLSFNDPKLNRKTLVKLIPLHQDKSYYTRDTSENSDKKSYKDEKHRSRSSRKKHKSKSKRSKSSGDTNRGKNKNNHSSKRRSASENFRSTREQMILDSMNTRKPVVRIKKGTILFPELVRIFKHKNQCKNNPCVILRRLKSLDLLHVMKDKNNICNDKEINLQTEINVTQNNNTEEDKLENNKNKIINEIENNTTDVIKLVTVIEENANNLSPKLNNTLVDNNKSNEFIDDNLHNKENGTAQLSTTSSATINNNKNNNIPEIQPNKILLSQESLHQDSSNDSCNVSIDVNFDESDISLKGLNTPIPSPTSELSMSTVKAQSPLIELGTEKSITNNLTTKRNITNFNDETIKNILNISYTSESEAKSLQKSQLETNENLFLLNSAQKYLTERQDHENEVTSTQGNNNISITEITSSSSPSQRLISDYEDLVQNDEVDTSNPSVFKLRYRRGRSNNVVTYAESETSLEGTLKRRRSLSNNADSSSTFYTDFIHHDEPPNAPSTTTTDIDIDTWNKKKRLKLTKTKKNKRKSVKNKNTVSQSKVGNHHQRKRKLSDEQQSTDTASTSNVNKTAIDIFDFTDDEATTTTTFTTASSVINKNLNFQYKLSDNDDYRIDSPAINVNLESTYKIYSKNSLVQNVFVPPEVEKIIEDTSSEAAKTILIKRKKRGRPRKL